jgi:VWFA-related protein
MTPSPRRRPTARGLRRTPVALGLLASTLLALPLTSPAVLARQTPAQAAPTFRGRADFVSVDVAVRRAGRPVAGLTAADFELLDNGVAQEISEISYEKLPIDVTIALDISASVSGPTLDQLRRSVTQLRADLTGPDRLRLLAFNMEITSLVDFDDPAGRIDQAMGRLSAAGSSSIFDVLAVTLAAPSTRDRRQLIVLFTDGEDSSSIVDPAGLLDVARRTTPTVAVVLAAGPSGALGYRTSVSPEDVAFRRIYDRLAAETGGLVVPLGRSDNVSSIFRRVLDEFRSSYVLHFTPKGVSQVGFHALAVRVKRADALEIRARSGYTLR